MKIVMSIYKAIEYLLTEELYLGSVDLLSIVCFLALSALFFTINGMY